MTSTQRPDDFARVDYTCKRYTPGHQVHFIQARKSSEGPAGEVKVIEAIDDDGTIRFTDGTSKWNHDVRRVKALFEHVGSIARLRAFNVLAIGSYLVCVSDEPGPCDARGRVPGESISDELARRGGILRPGREVLAELGLRSLEGFSESPSASRAPTSSTMDRQNGPLSPKPDETRWFVWGAGNQRDTRRKVLRLKRREASSRRGALLTPAVPP